MIVLMEDHTTAEARSQVSTVLLHAGVKGPLSMVETAQGTACCIAEKHLSAEVLAQLNAIPGVERVLAFSTPYQLASRRFQSQKTIVTVGNPTTSNVVEVGGEKPTMLAGPCAVEDVEQLHEIARAALDAGAQILRGGAFKPRTSPYAFQGLGVQGLKMLAEVREETGLPIITEVMEPGLVDEVAEYADILQIGCRNMQNFPLLTAAGKSGKPILLKRGFTATIEEWLLAAEYILATGNPNVILCERGIRSFDPHTRNLLDLSCIPLLGTLTHLPVVVDPSHSTGRRDLVSPMAYAAIAAGADGLLVDVHHHPERALCDGDQAILPEELQRLVQSVRLIHESMQSAYLIPA